MLRTARTLLLGGLVIALATACGSTKTSGFGDGDGDENGDPNGPGPGGGPGSFGTGSTAGMKLDPENATVIIDTATTPATPGSLTFKVIHNGDQDVTAGATFTVEDPSMGSFAGATFTSVASLPAGVLGKSTSVSAQTQSGTAVGTLTVVQLRKTGAQRDFFFIEPYQDAPSPTSDILAFGTNIQKVDVAFVMDTTGSMGGSIDNLKNALKGKLLGDLQKAIPDVGLAVVDYKDFIDGNNVVKVRQVVTTDLKLAQNAVGAMSATGGGDLPEAAIAGMQYTLLGTANPPVAAHTPAPGTFGGVDFRPGAVPVVVNITDAAWHDPSGNASMASLKTAFAGKNAKFVNVQNGGSESQANTLSDATSSQVPASAFGTVAGCSPGQCCTGINGAGRAALSGGMCRLNFLSSGGNGVSGGIVSAIKAIAVGSSYDVTAVPSNDPKNANGVDATKFIKTLRAMDEGNPANKCPAAPAKDSDGDGIKDTFLDVKVGTPVCFEVIPATNTTVPPAFDPQFFNAFIDVIGVQGHVQLDRRSVLFLVPPKAPGVN